MPTYERKTKNKTGLQHSDVCLSCRSYRPSHPPEEAIKAFSPTRIEWSYIDSPDFIRKVKKADIRFAGTINTIGGHRAGRNSIDYSGNTIVAPWMANFNDSGGPAWACINSPDAVAFRKQWMNTFLQLGADAIQHDDWLGNLAAFKWGGCFCSHCMTGFDRYVKENLPEEKLAEYDISFNYPFNYGEFLRTQYGINTPADYLRQRKQLPLQSEFEHFQRLSTRRYFRELQKNARDFADRGIPLSVNANLLPGQFAEGFVLDIVDYLTGETPASHEHYAQLLWMLKLADALRLPQIVSPFPSRQIRVNEVRSMLATVYALGHWPLVPWDVWQGPETADRWFGEPGDYADIYDFVRENDVFNGYRPWADVGVFVPAVSDPDQATAFANKGAALVAGLTQAGIPSRLITAGSVGGNLVHIPFESTDFEGLRVVFTCGSPGIAGEDLAGQFADFTANLQVIDAGPDADVSAEQTLQQAALAPSFSAADQNVHIFPRVRGNALALHLINRDYNASDDSHMVKEDLEVRIAVSKFAELNFKSATCYVPGSKPVYLKVENRGDWAEMVLPSLKTWAVVEVL